MIRERGGEGRWQEQSGSTLSTNFFQRTVEKRAEFGAERVKFHLVIENARLTDEEVAKLKDLIYKAAEEANTVLGW